MGFLDRFKATWKSIWRDDSSGRPAPLDDSGRTVDPRSKRLTITMPKMPRVGSTPIVADDLFDRIGRNRLRREQDELRQLQEEQRREEEASRRRVEEERQRQLDEDTGWIPVDSSNVEAIAYRPKRLMILLRFHKSGAEYSWYGQSREDFDAMLNAPSVGRLVNARRPDVIYSEQTGIFEGRRLFPGHYVGGD